MPRNLNIAIPSIGLEHCGTFALRQGLPLAKRLEAPMSFGTLSSRATLNRSPDGSYAVGCSGGGSYTPWIYPDASDLTARSVLTVAPGFECYGICVRNSFFVVYGTSGTIRVYSKSGILDAALNFTGFGTVWSVEFSPDGRYMAVLHSNAPYLRIYKTSDWSFVNRSGVSSPLMITGCFGHDSESFFGFTNESPYIQKVNPATGVSAAIAGVPASRRLSSTYEGQNRVWRVEDGKTICYQAAESATGIVHFNTLTNEILFSGNIGLNMGRVGSIGYSQDNGRILLTHQLYESRVLSYYDLNTREIRNLDYEAFGFRQLLRTGMSNNYIDGFILSSNIHKITGSVRDIDNLPAKRLIRTYQRDSGALVSEVFSDEITGDYSIEVDNDGPFNVQFLTSSGELLNDLFFAGVMAEPVV